MISYRSKDAVFVDELLNLLRKSGIETWIDREGIKPGTQWRKELFRKLQQCQACVVILSKEYLRSENCRMEVFIARSFRRPIIPVMIDDCFSMLSEHEETKGLEEIFMMRMHNLNAVGLPIHRSEALERVVRGVRAVADPPEPTHKAYVSYSGNRDGEFATEVASKLNADGVNAWVATQDVNVGENWRDAQARAMIRAESHVIVLDEKIVHSPVLRTEILLSEALGLPTFTVLPPRLEGQTELIASMLHDLDSGDQTYRRMTQTQYFKRDSLDTLSNTLALEKEDA
jgi:hypothetical protein